MKKGVMMRAGYDKGSFTPFSQTPPEDARSGEWTEERGREKLVRVKKQGGETIHEYETPVTGKKRDYDLVQPGTPEYDKWLATTPEAKARFAKRQRLETRKVTIKDLEPHGPVPGTIKPSTDLIKEKPPKYKKPTMQGMSIGAKNLDVKIGLGLGGSVGSKQKGRKMGCKGGGCATNRGKS